MRSFSKILLTLSAIVSVASDTIALALPHQMTQSETGSDSGPSANELEVPPHQSADVKNALWVKFGHDPEGTLAEVEELVHLHPGDYRYKVMNIDFLEQLLRFDERDYLSYRWRNERGVISGSIYPLLNYCYRNSIALEEKWLSSARSNITQGLKEYYDVSKDLSEAMVSDLGPLMNAILVHLGENSGKNHWKRKYSDKLLAENPTSFITYGVLAKRAFLAKPIDLENGRRNFREFMKARAANPEWEKWFAKMERSYSRHMEDRTFERSGIIFPNPTVTNPEVTQN